MLILRLPNLAVLWSSVFIVLLALMVCCSCLGAGARLLAMTEPRLLIYTGREALQSLASHFFDQENNGWSLGQGEELFCPTSFQVKKR